MQDMSKKKIIFKEKINKKKTKYTQKIRAYRLNLNPFFQEIRKTRGIEIPMETKRFIKLCFEIPGLRKAFVKLCKKQDMLQTFENIMKAILLFIIEETHKFKDQEPLNMFKRERFVYIMALPQIKTKIQHYLFNKSLNENQGKEGIIKELEEIYKKFREEEKKIKEEFERQNHPNPTESPLGFFRTQGNTILSAWDLFKVEKEQEFIYIFHECDSVNSDILISLIKIFSDKLTQILFVEKFNRQIETIRNELTRTHGSKYILDKVREEELVKLRAFYSSYLIKKRMIDKDDAKELIKKLRELSREEFENIKKLYVESKIKNLMAKDESLKYCIDKLESKETPLRLKGEKEMKKLNKKMAKRGIKDDSLYPSTKEKYYERWMHLLRGVSMSNIIADLNKI